jgi:hypothetical protein
MKLFIWNDENTLARSIGHGVIIAIAPSLELAHDVLGEYARERAQKQEPDSPAYWWGAVCRFLDGRRFDKDNPTHVVDFGRCMNQPAPRCWVIYGVSDADIWAYIEPSLRAAVLGEET